MSNYKTDFIPPYSSRTYPVLDIIGKRNKVMDKVWRCQVCNKRLMSGDKYNIIIDGNDRGIAYTCLSQRCVSMRIFQLM